MAYFLPHRPPTAAQSMVAALAVKMRHILANEALGGVFLLLAAGAALLLANSPWHTLYESALHLPFSLSAAGAELRFDAHFLVNDVLMTLFFLSAGLEIRQEIYDGALSNLRQAVLPLFAALGGVCLPALIYLGVNAGTAHMHGWAVPTATDIAFAVGILALLGKGVPAQVRVVLLALAIIDDIIAVLIIAFFYSGGLSWDGAALAAAAVAGVLLLQFFGFRHALLYAAAGAVLWLGLWRMGIHPSLAGVALGLLTPVLPCFASETADKKLPEAAAALSAAFAKGAKSAKSAGAGGAADEAALQALKTMRQIGALAEPPVERLRNALHLWVAFGIMPLFAFVNAGVRLADVDFSAAGSVLIAAGVMGGLIVGKPLGIVAAAFLAVKSGLCRLPPQLNWGGMALVGLLGGIGFTMAIFVAMLAYGDKTALAVATLGILCGSAVSAVLGLSYGFFYCRRGRGAAVKQPHGG